MPWEASGPAFVREESVAHGGVCWTLHRLHEDMLNGAGPGARRTKPRTDKQFDLECVAGKLSVFADKTVTCNNALESGLHRSETARSESFACVCNQEYFHIWKIGLRTMNVETKRRKGRHVSPP